MWSYQAHFLQDSFTIRSSCICLMEDDRESFRVKMKEKTVDNVIKHFPEP